MSDRKLLGASKITIGWKFQFPVDARQAINRRDRKKFKIGDRVVFYLEPDGRVVLERG